MTTADDRIANAKAKANAVPPTPEYLAAKAQLLANIQAGTHLADGTPNNPPF